MAVTVRRWARLFAGLFLFGLGIVLLVKSGLGASPWDVLHTGVQARTGLRLGLVVIASAVLVCCVAAAWGVKPGLGTYANTVAVGLFVDLLFPVIPAAVGVPAGLGFLGGGIACFGVATGVYAGANLGLGPRDALMMAWHRRYATPLWWVRLRLEGVAFVAGALLGGQLGVGTIVFACLVGPATHLGIRALAPGLESPMDVMVPAPVALAARTIDQSRGMSPDAGLNPDWIEEMVPYGDHSPWGDRYSGAGVRVLLQQLFRKLNPAGPRARAR